MIEKIDGDHLPDDIKQALQDIISKIPNKQGPTNHGEAISLIANELYSWALENNLLEENAKNNMYGFLMGQLVFNFFHDCKDEHCTCEDTKEGRSCLICVAPGVSLSTLAMLELMSSIIDNSYEGFYTPTMAEKIFYFNGLISSFNELGMNGEGPAFRNVILQCLLPVMHNTVQKMSSTHMFYDKYMALLSSGMVPKISKDILSLTADMFTKAFPVGCDFGDSFDGVCWVKLPEKYRDEISVKALDIAIYNLKSLEVLDGEYKNSKVYGRVLNSLQNAITEAVMSNEKYLFICALRSKVLALREQLAQKVNSALKTDINSIDGIGDILMNVSSIVSRKFPSMVYNNSMAREMAHGHSLINKLSLEDSLRVNTNMRIGDLALPCVDEFIGKIHDVNENRAEMLDALVTKYKLSKGQMANAR